MPLGLLDNPTLITLKDEGLVLVAHTFPAEQLWSGEGDLQPWGIQAGWSTTGSVAKPWGCSQHQRVPLASSRHSSPRCPSSRVVRAKPDLSRTGATGPRSSLHTRVLGGRGPGLSRAAHCNEEQLVSKSRQGKQWAAVLFPGFAETPLRPCPRFSPGSDKAERDKSQIVLLCPTDWLHRA